MKEAREAERQRRLEERQARQVRLDGSNHNLKQHCIIINTRAACYYARFRPDKITNASECKDQLVSVTLERGWARVAGADNLTKLQPQ